MATKNFFATQSYLSDNRFLHTSEILPTFNGKKFDFSNIVIRKLI